MVFRRELEHLQLARAIALNVDNPSRAELIRIYDDNLQNDAHLKNVWRKRILNVTNKNFVILDQNGEVSEEFTSVFRRRWFRDFVTYSMESLGYGYSLIGFDDGNDDTIFVVHCFPRENVSPDYMSIFIDETNTSRGAQQLDLSEMSDLFVFVAPAINDLGLFNTSAPMTILKRHSWANWDEFEEIFGVPMRIAKTDTRDPRQTKEIANWLDSMGTAWLDSMGTAPYAIFPPESEIEIKESSSRDAYNVFLQKIEAVNKEVSKLFLGQTMTTDDGSSLSQAAVHSATEAAIVADDLSYITTVVNDQLFALVRDRGVAIPDGYRFEFLDAKMSPSERLEKIDGRLLSSGVALSREYLEKTYGVEIDEAPELGAGIVASLKKKSLNLVRKHYDDNSFGCCPSFLAQFTPAVNDSIISQIIAAIHAGGLQNVPDSLIQQLANSYAEVLTVAISDGYEVEVPDETDINTVNSLNQNINSFATAKARSEVETIASLVVDDFDEFETAALQVHELYNGSFLQSEFNTTLNASQTLL
jgi:hypothetical protein